VNDVSSPIKYSVAIGSDHAGFVLKEAVREGLAAKGVKVTDFGTHSEESVDYPDFAKAVATSVAMGEHDLGVLICGTGIGMSMAANRVKGIRAAACSEPYSARMARAHNNANVLCMGGRVVGPGLALDIVTAFLETEFEFGSRHERRVAMISAMESC